MEQTLTTAAGRTVTVPASTRLEYPLYNLLLKQVQADGVNVSTYLRELVLRELGPKLPPAETGSAKGG